MMISVARNPKPLNPDAKPWLPFPHSIYHKPPPLQTSPENGWPLTPPPTFVYAHPVVVPSFTPSFPGLYSYYQAQIQPRTSADEVVKIERWENKKKYPSPRKLPPRKWVAKNVGCLRTKRPSLPPPPPPPPPPSPPSPEHGVEVLSGYTTVMIRNIPNQYRRKMLLDFLDQLCLKQNHQPNGFRFEYDFVYLPMDFVRGDNLGYAFVNFTSTMAASKIWELLHNYKWGEFKDSLGSSRESKKICEITWARIQGREELTNHFRNSNFVCSDVEYLPVLFSPPRDGETLALAVPRNIGKCLYSSSTSLPTKWEGPRKPALMRNRTTTSPLRFH